MSANARTARRTALSHNPSRGLAGLCWAAGSALSAAGREADAGGAGGSPQAIPR